MERNNFITNKIYSARIERNLSQKELGDLIDRSETYIKSVEMGQEDVSVLMVIRFCTALNITPAEFFNDYTEM